MRKTHRAMETSIHPSTPTAPPNKDTKTQAGRTTSPSSNNKPVVQHTADTAKGAGGKLSDLQEKLAKKVQGDDNLHRMYICIIWITDSDIFMFIIFIVENNSPILDLLLLCERLLRML